VTQHLRYLLATGLSSLLLLASCGEPAATTGTTAAAGTDAVTVPETVSSAAPAPLATSPELAATTATTSKPFRFSKQRIGPDLARRMSASWRPGCPVPLEDLRYLRIRYRRFDGRLRMGEMVVHRDVVPAVRSIFRDAYYAGFRIRKMRLVDDYGADDNRSMEANNTSAFNCRVVAGTSIWSQHAYGRAIDVNPVQNPYVKGSTVLPSKGRNHLDRSVPSRGKILEGDAFVRAVDAVGWGWGGRWSSSKDYHHISSTGR
jgi:hypothetical protein